MLAFRIGLLVVHVTAAAYLFGGSAGIARPLRRNLELGAQALAVAAEDAVRRARYLGMSSLMTVMTGVSLIFASYPSFGAAPKNFHAALGIMIVSIGISLGLLRPTTKALFELSRAQPFDPGGVRGQLKKLAAAQGMMHLLWLINLVLMFVRF
jgi:hypothetical protein